MISGSSTLCIVSDTALSLIKSIDIKYKITIWNYDWEKGESLIVKKCELKRRLKKCKFRFSEIVISKHRRKINLFFYSREDNTPIMETETEAKGNFELSKLYKSNMWEYNIRYI